MKTIAVLYRSIANVHLVNYDSEIISLLACCKSCMLLAPINQKRIIQPLAYETEKKCAQFEINQVSIQKFTIHMF